ncbi:MAG: archaellin/type IV pilin N-terminal domain-containing protein [Dehalococcoidia bacterium]
MLKKLASRMHKDQKGITGLETAIILIAFVVVAAVFAYTVLSAGIFTTQKAQQAVYTGLEEVEATLQIKGSVIATANTTGANGTVDDISFTVEGAMAGLAIDFSVPPDNVVVISYLDSTQVQRDLDWSITKVGDADEDNLLEGDEKFEISIDLTALSLGPDTTFSIELKPPTGAVMTIERTTPAWIDAVMDFH